MDKQSHSATHLIYYIGLTQRILSSQYGGLRLGERNMMGLNQVKSENQLI